jgi:hypothetical protein
VAPPPPQGTSLCPLPGSKVTPCRDLIELRFNLLKI